MHVWCARSRTLLRSFPEDADEEWNEDAARGAQTAGAEKVRSGQWECECECTAAAACGPHTPSYTARIHRPHTPS